MPSDGIQVYKSTRSGKVTDDAAIEQAIANYGFEKKFFGEPVQNAIDSFIDPDSMMWKPQKEDVRFR